MIYSLLYYGTFFLLNSDVSVAEDVNAEELAAEMAELVRKEKKINKKKFVRSAAGTTWEDSSLSEWNPGKFLQENIKKIQSGWIKI